MSWFFQIAQERAAASADLDLLALPVLVGTVLIVAIAGCTLLMRGPRG